MAISSYPIQALIASPRATAPVDVLADLRKSVALSAPGQPISAETVEALRRTGIFRAARPKEADGLDLTPVEQLYALEQLAIIDPSVGWCAMIGMDSGIHYRYLPVDAAEALFSDPDSISAGWVNPVGTAELVDGGFLISGTWRFGSGIGHADVVIAGCTIVSRGRESNGPWADGDSLVAVLPANKVCVDPLSWSVGGLAGTGSFDYTIKDQWVSSSQVFSWERPVHAGSLTRWPDALVRKMPGVPLGAARKALDWVYDDAGQSHGSERRLNRPSVQMGVAEAEARLVGARAYVIASLDELWGALEAGIPPSAQVRAHLLLSRQDAFRAARDVITTLFDSVGTRAARNDVSPLEGLLRDVQTANQHAVAQNSIKQEAGLLLAGMTSKVVFA